MAIAEFSYLVTSILSAATVAAHVALLYVGAMWLSRTLAGEHVHTASTLSWIGRLAMPLAFCISLASVVGSLVYSEVIHFPPCSLCWYQRIFMYPLPILLFIGWRAQDREVYKYVMWLAIVGGVIALYHTVLQFMPTSDISLPCLAAGGISCSEKFFVQYGYVSIPTMSLTSFAMVAVCMALGRRVHRAI